MFVRPQTATVDATRTAVPGACPACGAQDLAAYRVLSEGGWWDVVKCRQCLVSVERRPGPLQLLEHGTRMAAQARRLGAVTGGLR